MLGLGLHFEDHCPGRTTEEIKGARGKLPTSLPASRAHLPLGRRKMWVGGEEAWGGRAELLMEGDA